MTRQTTIIQNIHAPVFGHVAAGDIHSPPPPGDDEPPPLETVEQKLRGERAALLREHVGWWLNWPAALLLVWIAAGGVVALQSFLDLMHSDGWLGWGVVVGLILPMTALAAWLQRHRRMRSYRIAQLSHNVTVLERELSLRRAGLM